MPRRSSAQSEVLTATSSRPKRSASSTKDERGTKRVRNAIAAAASNDRVKLKTPVGEGAEVLPTDNEKKYENSSTENAYWLMKAEPDSRIEKGVDVKFSIDDLENADTPEPWDGVRNHTAKNHMKMMKKGELAFFYHSSCKIPGVAGIMEIVQEATVDESAFDKEHPYYDEKSTRENPRWFNVHVAHRETFPSFVPLKQLTAYTVRDGALADMQLFKQTRLSISKVSEKEWELVTRLGRTVKEEPK